MYFHYTEVMMLAAEIPDRCVHACAKVSWFKGSITEMESD